jgi:hypothetical protein
MEKINLESSVKQILNEIIDIVIDEVNNENKKDETRFIEEIFMTILKIIGNPEKPKNNDKLEKYEYQRYGTIAALLREFINNILVHHTLNTCVKDKLYGYLDYSYVKSKYYYILHNINNVFKQKKIILADYDLLIISEFKFHLLEYLKKQQMFLGILQNKAILKTINKESINDLFNKIIFELTIYIKYFIN